MISLNRSLRCFPFMRFCLGFACVLACAGARPVQAQVWRAMGPAGGDVRALASDPAHPEVLYLGTTDGAIFASRDAGADWQQLGVAGGKEKRGGEGNIGGPPRRCAGGR